MKLERYIRDIPDFPKPGIIFKDITPLLKDISALRAAVEGLAAPFAGAGVDYVAAVESRGFIVGSMVADKLGAGFIPLRKPGKLPYETISETYSLEYGEDSIEVHKDAAGKGDKVLLVDDLLATGGTISAARDLMTKLGAEVVGAAFIVELDFLNGRQRIPGLEVVSLLHYDGE